MPYILFRNKKIFYHIEGQGKPVLLLHGFGENGNIWNKQAEPLQKNYSVIVPDLPGSGQSEILEGACTLDDYAEAVKAIADEAIQKNKNNKTNQFCMIGHSMGGYITLAFAEKYPELLNSFGLFHSSAFADTDTKIATRKKGIEFIKKNGSAAFLKTINPNLFSKNSQNAHPELIEQLLEIGKDISPEALIQYYEAMILRPDRTTVLSSFSKPVLFIIGKEDTVVPLESSLRQCHLPAVSSVHILQQSGHIGMWEEENTATSCLERFLHDFL